MASWEGTGSDRLFLGHATGFCKEIWGALVDELRAAGVVAPITAWDFRAHGDSDVPAPPYDWWSLGQDVLAVVDAVADGRDRVGVGHSGGAAALVLAELLRAGTFDRLVLIEPIVFPPPFQRMVEHPLAEAAEKRKPAFPSPDAARENFAEKEVFAGWDERALDDYVAGGLRSAGGEWQLKCPPWAEADMYRGATAHGAWDRLDELGPPTLVVAGQHSDTHPAPFVPVLTKRFPDARSTIVTDAGHFLPMERPQEVARLIADFVFGN